MGRQSYPTDMTDLQWERLYPFLPTEYPGRGRRPDTPLREVVNAIFYRWFTSCGWRMLPHDFPPWPTVYEYYRRWNADGTLKTIKNILKPRRCRTK